MSALLLDLCVCLSEMKARTLRPNRHVFQHLINNEHPMHYHFHSLQSLNKHYYCPIIFGMDTKAITNLYHYSK